MNKTLWLYWHSGFENCPSIVKKCIDNWKFYNSNYKIMLLSDKNISEYIDIPRENHTIQAWSDIVRINLLYNYGGVWADSTVACNQSLEEWLPEKGEYGFFAFSNPSYNIRVASWFLYGEQNNIIINQWKKLVDIYWKSPNFKAYLWFHILFNDVIKNKECEEMWSKIYKWNANYEPFPESSNNPHYFTPYRYNRWKSCNEPLIAPLYKLTHHSNHSDVTKEPNIMRIFNVHTKI